MERKLLSLAAYIVLFITLECCLLCAAEANRKHQPDLNASQEQAEPPYLDDGFDGELQDSGRDLSSITKLVGSYIGSYASSAAAWIKYPYFGISTGVATVMVFLVIFYILILVSGAVVVNGRDGLVSPGKLDLHREQLTHSIMKAIDHVANKFSEKQPVERSRSSESSYVWDRASGQLKLRSKRGTEENGRQSINAYVSTTVYNVLTWLSKPFMGYIVVLAAVALYMVVIVQVAMTSNVFPLASLGRSLAGTLSPLISSHLNDDLLVRAAADVIKAINDWEGRDLKDD